MTNRTSRNKLAFLAATIAVCAAIFTACENPTGLPTFTVSFNLNGGSGSPPATQTVDAGASITLPGNSEFTSPAGYNFAGWSTNADGPGTMIHNAGAPFTPTRDVTMFARWEPVQTFVVSFNPNQGTGVVPAVSANQGQGVILPGGDALVRPGWTFAGWNTQADGAGLTHEAGSLFTPVGNTTLYARWVTTVTVTFNSNGGTGTVPARQVGQGLGFILPSGATLSRAGYVFVAWNTASDGHGVDHYAGEMFTPQGNVILHARWQAGFTVTFNPNGGTGTVPAQAVVASSTMTLPDGAALSRPGYVFDGWNTNAAGDGINYPAGGTFRPTGNTTLFARWVAGVAFTVTFHANEGEGTPPGPMTVNEGSAITLPGGEGLSKAGFIFGGWNTNAGGTGTDHAAGASFTPTANITLFARWNPAPTFTVTFNANSGTGTVPAQTVPQGSATTLPGGEGFSRTGFIFIGWNANAAAAAAAHEAGAAFTPTADTTLFAIWTPGFTVTFNPNGGTGTVPAQFVAQGSGTVLPGGEGFSRPGFVFGGWNTNAGGTGANHAPGSLFVPGGNVTLFAVWISSITVTFNVNGGIGIVLPRIVEPGASLAIPDGDGLVRPGFAFDGWNENADGAGINRAAGETFTPTANITLFARWVATVTFDANGGDGAAPEPQTAVAGSAITLPGGEGLTRAGFVFGGWNTEADGAGTNFNAGVAFTPNGDTTLYARWITVHTITFHVNGGAGTAPAARTVMAGQSITLPGDEGISREGFTFGGWNTLTGGGGTNFNAGATYAPTASLTLYARWLVNVTVTFNANGGAGTVPSQTVPSGFVITLPDGSGLSREGFAFGGWNTMANGAGTNFNAGAAFTPTANVTLYARWLFFTVAFNLNGGFGTTPTSGTVAPGSGMTLPDDAGFSKPGYTFGGWNTMADGTGVNFNAGSTYTPPGDVTLYARWIVNFTVTFDANGGHGMVPSQTVPSGSAATLPGGDALTRAGFAFAGWNTEADGTGNNYSAGAAFTPTGNVTLYARWALPALTGTVGITGIARIGQTLTANTDNIGGSGTISFQWRRGTSDVGTNSDTYVVQTEDAGSTITVTVTRANNLGSVTSAPTATVAHQPAFRYISARAHTVGIREDGTLWAWGSNTYGQLGDGTTTNRSRPVRIGTDSDWASVSAGNQHTVGVRTDGTLWAWGHNSNGQLGDGGTTTNRTSPVRIGTDSNWASVSAGGLYTVGVRTDGTLWAWGRNGNGQLGDGTRTDRSSPVRIGTASNWASVSAGNQYTVGVQTDSTLWAWGHNEQGQLGLGDGSTTDRLSPVRIGAASDWASVSAWQHTVGVRNGTLWAWGWNTSGQVGDGTTTRRLSPVRIGTASDWASVSVGTSHTVGMRTDGTLWAWGANGNGALGDGTTTNRHIPARIGTASDWVSVFAGSSHTVGMRTDGTLWAWGLNTSGQVGDGTTTNRTSPVRID